MTTSLVSAPTLRRQAHSVLSILASFFVAFVSFFPLTNTDIWWHLAAGREMVRRKMVLGTDPFAFTIPHAEWIDLHWLFQLLSWTVHSMGGVAGLLAMKTVLLVAMTLCVIRSTRSVFAAAVASLVLAGGVYEARFLLLVRPGLITVAGIAFFICCFEKYRKTGHLRYLLFMIPYQILWTNMQGLFILGPGIALGYVLEAYVTALKRRVQPHAAHRTAGVSLLIALSCFVNPWGVRGVLFPFRLLGRIDPSVKNLYSRNVAENIPLLELGGADSHYLVSVSVVTLLLVLGFWCNRREFRVAHVCMAAAFLALAYMAKRNIVLFFVAAAPLAGIHWGAVLECFHARPRPMARSARTMRIVTAGAGILCSLLLVMHFNTVIRYPRHTLLSPFRYPLRVTAYLREHPVAGNMFNAIRHGGYLLWQCYPSKQVFIDGRLIIRPPAFFAEYLALLDEPAHFDRVAKNHAITHAVIPTTVYNRYHRLLGYLYHHPLWRMDMIDEEAALFVRTTGAVVQEKGLRIGAVGTRDSIYTDIEHHWSREPWIAKEAIERLRRTFHAMEAGHTGSSDAAGTVPGRVSGHTMTNTPPRARVTPVSGTHQVHAPVLRPSAATKKCTGTPLTVPWNCLFTPTTHKTGEKQAVRYLYPTG